MRVIGLNGQARAGKDTVCRFIKELGTEQGLTVVREGFADRLKLSAARVFFPEIELEEAVAWCNVVKENGTLTVIVEDETGRRSQSISGRTWFQRYGTEAHREVFDEDFWIEHVLAPLRPGVDILVVTDVRFPNEAEAVLSYGGELWEIIRPNSGIAERDHDSEDSLDGVLFEVVIGNGGSLESLRDVVAKNLALDDTEALSRS